MQEGEGYDYILPNSNLEYQHLKLFWSQKRTGLILRITHLVLMCKELSWGHIRVLHESRFWQRYFVAPGTLSHPACTQHFFPCHFLICICQTLSCLQWQLQVEFAIFFSSWYWKWGGPVKQTSLKYMKRVEDFYPFIYFKLVCLTGPLHFQYREEKKLANGCSLQTKKSKTRRCASCKKTEKHPWLTHSLTCNLRC